MNPAIKILTEIMKRLTAIDERQKEILFSAEDYEKIEKEERKLNWICENH